MPRPLTQQEREAFLAESHVAVLSLPSDDACPPLSFPVWYGYEPGGLITWYSYRSEPKPRKLRLIHRGSVLSLCVQREALPYKYVTVEGTVVAENDGPTSEQRLAIISRYLPADEAEAYLRNEIESGVNLVHFTIRPDRWASLDFAEDAG